MSLVEALRSVDERGLLTHHRAGDFLCGCVAQERDGAWVRPLRFLPSQLRVLESCTAWHPGLFRQMARATAGVCLRFRTDATEVALSVRLDAPSGAAAARLRRVGATRPQGATGMPQDGISCDVDGRHLPVSSPASLGDGLPGLPHLAGASLVSFRLEAPGEAPEPGLQVLPGFGVTREVTLWLPCLAGCSVADLWTNGLTMDAAPARPELLVLGDGVAQGLGADDPGLSWPARLAGLLDLDLLDQGIAGQVFQQGTAAPLAARPRPARVIVAYGAGYRHEACNEARVRREVAGFLAEVSRVWPDVSCQVVTPLWHDEDSSRTHRLSCFAAVPGILRRAALPHAQMSLVDGTRLTSHRRELFADADHPGAAGAAEVASRLLAATLLCDHSPEGLAGRAGELLRDAPMRAFPIRECVRRGIGEVLFAEPGCVLLRVPDGNQYVYAPDRQLGRAAMGLLLEPTLVTVCGPGLEADVRELLGLDLVEPYHLVVYEGEAPLRVDQARASGIRPLDASYAQTVREHYGFPQFVSLDAMRERLARGSVLGAFEGDELVGFVGEHDEGSIGMLEVFPGHRGRGWGEALMATKVNEFLSRGQTPWTEVYPYNKTSLRMMGRLGLTVYPATDQCFVSRGA